MFKPAVIRRRPLPAADPLAAVDLHPVVRRVLLARGVRSAGELQLGLGDLLAPDSLGGVERAAEMLADAVEAQQRVLIVGDFDADGATGTVLAMRALRAMGAGQVDFRVPNRFEFGYGLTPGLVDTLSLNPPDVLVTVDSGIACVAGVGRARALGCQVIVTDHHLPGEVLPAANAIVNPNCTGDAFPSKALAGVGVMFYLAVATRGALRKRGWFGAARPEPNLAGLLDLVALGTVADLVPLDYNNRILVRHGLERIRCGRSRPGLMALLRAGNRDYRHASAADLGYAVAPRLNAAGRLEDMSVGIRCLLSEDRDEAEHLALQLDELNRQRRDLQEQMHADAETQVRALVDALQAETSLPAAICLFDERWHQGVVGLVASKIKDAVHRPVVAFAPERPAAPQLKGSARSVRGLHIRDALALVDARRPGLLTAFGGHAMAAGLTLPRERLATFREALDSAVRGMLDGETLEAEILTDGSLEPDDIGLELAHLLQAAGPWGQRFPEPLFDGRFVVLERRVVGGGHLKLRVRAEHGREPLHAIAFTRTHTAGTSTHTAGTSGYGLEDLPNEALVRLLYRLDVNRWRGSESCQLLVERIVPAESFHNEQHQQLRDHRRLG